MREIGGGLILEGSKRGLYEIELFKEEGFIRKKCIKCGRYFWTLDPEQDVCTDQPCGEYTFIGHPLNPSLSLSHIREKFLQFFERHGHVRVKRYPVVARWREDVYLVGASIYDFQPWVTEGIVPPPANPLTISQPCIRLTDIEKVGRTGRHLTTFEMMAHHAFNFGKISTYWNNETVRYSYEFFTRELGIPREEITYIEDWWSGGGNAGEDFEVIIKGLEVATLVFMHYKVIDNKIHPMRNYIVDTGYGLERIFWLLTGAPTVYDALFGDLVEVLRKKAGVEKLEKKMLEDISKYAGKFDIDIPEIEREVKTKLASKYGYELEEFENLLRPYEVIYRLLDHARALMFMLGDGIVPSNSGEGYLARLVIRRCLKDILLLDLPFDLVHIVDLQIEKWRRDFPEYLEVRDVVAEILSIEAEKFKRLIERGKLVVKRKVLGRRGKRAVSYDDLVELYDSHGIPPEIVRETLSREGVVIDIPEDFYSRLAKRHETAITVPREEKWLENLKEKLKELPPTETTYYELPEETELKAKILKVLDGGRIVVLDKTIFYPEGGGAESDRGLLRGENFEARVVDVKKINNVIIHICENQRGKPYEGSEVTCVIDQARRRAIMRAHTATHVVLGAARKLLGKHVWQAGAHKSEDRGRLDITFYRRLSEKDILEIERETNRVVLENREVNIYYMDRNKAEQKYGFVLYQGGVVPEKVLRIVEVDGWDVEACGGLHCTRTGEIGLVKIVRSERIQDGVERLEFVVGEAAVKYIQDMDIKLRNLSRILSVDTEKLDAKVQELVSEIKALREKVSELKGELVAMEVESLVNQAEKLGPFRIIVKQYNGDRYSLEDLREIAFKIRDQYGNTIAFLYNDKLPMAEFIVALGEEVLSSITADIIREKLTERSIRVVGGGRRHFLQGRLAPMAPKKIVEILIAVLRNCLEKG
ncbi:MAG: alanine--tRNA ligase [Thermoprotei archaeon]|nr:MAG: alanine--tRNA ligase [Thermoprotei archaeon]